MDLWFTKNPKEEREYQQLVVYIQGSSTEIFQLGIILY